MSSSLATLLLVAITLGFASCQPPPPPPFMMANMFGDHMVLQQAPAQANIWGYATKCDSTITATFDGKTYPATTFTDAHGMCVWKVMLPATKADASKAYTISVTSSKYGSVQITDVLFGDVWVCGGQSNMQFSVSQVYNAENEIEASANYPKIRLFTASLEQSNTPQAQLMGVEQPWSIAGPKSVGGGNWTYFSAVCWFFGKEIFDRLKYPIGLVASNYGGTPVEAWSSPDALKQCKQDLEEPVNSNNKVDGPNQPSVLWNAMINPLLNMTIKGAIWYQGESNAGSTNYNCTFPAMIDDWRAKWYAGTNQQTTPLYFGFVQLAPTGNTNMTVGGFPVIRWAQTANYGYAPNKRMENVFMAVAIDLGDPTSPFGSVHPRDKENVGTRLMLGAMSVVYNSTDVYYLGMLPQTAKMSTDMSTSGIVAVAVTFGPPSTKGKLELRYPYGFELSCADPSGKAPTQWIEGTAKSVTDSDVNVEFPQCTGTMKPTQIRYCWRTDPCTYGKCPIYSSVSNPSPPFIMDLN